MEDNAEPVATLYWFDNDLRLDDNPGLERAIAGASTLLCIYCHDPSKLEADTFGTRRLGRLRKRFIDQALGQLAESLHQRKQALLQVLGNPTVVLSRLIQQHHIQRVVRSRQFGYFEGRHWEQLRQEHPLVDFVEVDGYTLFTGKQISGIGALPETFSKFRRQAEPLTVGLPIKLHEFPLPPPSPEPAPVARVDPITASTAIFQGGEDIAKAHVDSYFASQAPSSYKQTRNELDGWSNSSKMSPWLATGCLSARRLYQRLQQYEQGHGANESTYWLFFELLWREYFQWYALQHAEKLFLPAGIHADNHDYEFDAGRFKSWCRGETPWPLVNACMRQLNQTGYLSNRARQIVASALINELGLDWRCGAGYFEKQLIDYDVASNWGNWQYIAGVGADPRGGRHFNIEKQARQFDADGKFVARWPGSQPRADSDNRATTTS